MKSMRWSTLSLSLTETGKEKFVENCNWPSGELHDDHWSATKLPSSFLHLCMAESGWALGSWNSSWPLFAKLGGNCNPSTTNAPKWQILERLLHWMTKSLSVSLPPPPNRLHSMPSVASVPHPSSLLLHSGPPTYPSEKYHSITHHIPFYIWKSMLIETGRTLAFSSASFPHSDTA